MAPRSHATPEHAARPAGPWPQAQDLRALHRSLALLRAVDLRSLELSQAGHAGAYMPLAGSECVLAGVAATLAPKDWVLPGRRQSAIALLRGLSCTAWFAQVLGRTSDPSRGRQEPGHLGARAVRVTSPSSIVGANLPHATGVALAMKNAGRREVAVALAGMAAVAGPDFHVALNFAAVWGAPAVFVITSGPGLEQHSASESVAVKASAYGITAVTCDGSDVVAVGSALEGALERARDGGGPMLVEARVPDAGRALHVVGRDVDDDPAARLAAQLVHEGVFSEEDARATQESVTAEVEAAALAALALPPPPASTLFDDVFARRTPALDAQRVLWLKES